MSLGKKMSISFLVKAYIFRKNPVFSNSGLWKNSKLGLIFFCSKNDSKVVCVFHFVFLGFRIFLLAGVLRNGEMLQKQQKAFFVGMVVG